MPNPPDKGDRIRAHHELLRIASRARVHLVCFARSPQEIAAALELRDRCASIYVEVLPKRRRTAAALARFALGGCLTTSFYSSSKMRRHIAGLRVDATVAYCSAMTDYAPAGAPLVIDLVDVDSEKWRQYGDTRSLGWFYHREAGHVRGLEKRAADRAVCSFVATRRELELIRPAAAGARTAYFENGVDLAYFNPAAVRPLPELENRPALVFVGEMDYFPNVEAAGWFARDCFPLLRRAESAAEFWIVGRNPSREVRKLAGLPGVRVTGKVRDVRPYLRSAAAVVAPLRVARGIQNKVLEALAMGKHVLASPAVCETLAPSVPEGVVCCGAPTDYAAASAVAMSCRSRCDEAVRLGAGARFSWDRNVQALLDVLDEALSRGATAAAGSKR